MRVLFAAAMVVGLSLAHGAELKPDTIAAFDHYMRVTDANMARTLSSGFFLTQGRVKHSEVSAIETKTLENGKEISIPGGDVHHWIGTIFIPGVSLKTVKSVMTDYDNYSHIYAPDIIASRLLRSHDNTYDVFLRIAKTQVITVVLNTDYKVEYHQPTPERLLVRSISTRVAEVKDSSVPTGAEYPVGKGNGIIWRLNSYWRFEQGDGGVYAECESISLSRDVPFIVQGIVNAITRKFPVAALRDTMTATKREVMARASQRVEAANTAEEGERSRTEEPLPQLLESQK